MTIVETMIIPTRTAQIQSLSDTYVSENSNIDIELISPPYEQADNKLAMMLNSNQELDIIEVRDHTVKQYVNNDKLVDLSSYMSHWEGTSDFLPLIRIHVGIEDVHLLLEDLTKAPEEIKQCMISKQRQGLKHILIY